MSYGARGKGEGIHTENRKRGLIYSVVDHFVNQPRHGACLSSALTTAKTSPLLDPRLLSLLVLSSQVLTLAGFSTRFMSNYENHRHGSFIKLTQSH